MYRLRSIKKEMNQADADIETNIEERLAKKDAEDGMPKHIGKHK